MILSVIEKPILDTSEAAKKQKQRNAAPKYCSECKIAMGNKIGRIDNHGACPAHDYRFIKENESA